MCVGETKLPYGYAPLLFYGGELKCQTRSGKLVNLSLTSHSYFSNLNDLSPEEIYVYLTKLKESFMNACALKRYQEAWKLAELLNKIENWFFLGKTLINHLEIELAIKVYRRIGDAAIVSSLLELQNIEDRKVLAGEMAVLCDQFDDAQELFLESTKPHRALDMRRDLLQWNQALQLAKSLSPEQVPYVSKEYAQQLEFNGDWSNALMNYERGTYN